jgi:hypothetical protein
MQQVDRSVSQALGAFLNNAFTPLIALIAIGSALPLLIPCVSPALVVGVSISLTYMKAARDLKRIDSTTRSPVYALFNEVGSCGRMAWFRLNLNLLPERLIIVTADRSTRSYTRCVCRMTCFRAEPPY